jgi:hypothetical protein
MSTLPAALQEGLHITPFRFCVGVLLKMHVCIHNNCYTIFSLHMLLPADVLVACLLGHDGVQAEVTKYQ